MARRPINADHENERFYTDLDLDMLMLKAFKDAGEDHKLPSAVKEHMLNDQEDFMEGNNEHRYSSNNTTTKNVHIRRLQDKATKFTVDSVDFEKIQSFKLNGNSMFTSNDYK